MHPHEPVLEWRVHLLRQQPEYAVRAAVVIVLGGLIAAVLLNSAWFGALAILMLWMATREYWLPLRYRIDADGASLRYFGAVYLIPWDRVAYCMVDAVGVKLSSAPPQSRLQPFRGVYLRYADNRDAVMKAIDHWRSATHDG